MPKIIDNRINSDTTIRVFDNFYSTDLIVGANEFDEVYGYFKSVCENEEAASNFSVVLFRISQDTGMPVLELLYTLQGTNNTLEMNKLMCYYLNTFKSLTSIYGVGNIPIPVEPVARNVVQ